MARALPEEQAATGEDIGAPLDIDRLFREHGAFVARVVERLIGKTAQVDDLVQETFVVAFKKRDTFAGRSTPKTWLYAIARNLCHRHTRSRRRFELFRATLETQPEPEHERDLPQVELEHRESIARVHRALQQLPFEQREIATLYELEGLEGKEISELVGIPIGTVWTRLTKARQTMVKAMRRELAKEAWS